MPTPLPPRRQRRSPSSSVSPTLSKQPSRSSNGLTGSTRLRPGPLWLAFEPGEETDARRIIARGPASR